MAGPVGISRSRGGGVGSRLRTGERTSVGGGIGDLGLEGIGDRGLETIGDRGGGGSWNWRNSTCGYAIREQVVFWKGINSGKSAGMDGR